MLLAGHVKDPLAVEIEEELEEFPPAEIHGKMNIFSFPFASRQVHIKISYTLVNETVRCCALSGAVTFPCDLKMDPPIQWETGSSIGRA